MEGTQILKGDYAAKIFHKQTLASKRIAVYEGPEEPTMTNLLDSVYKEIDIWKYLEHPNLLKLYQVIDDPDDEKIYCIMQLAELGQLMKWNEEELKYEHNPKIISFLKEKYYPENVFSSPQSLLEALGKIIFEQVIKGIQFLHEKCIIHRDIKIDVLYFLYLLLSLRIFYVKQLMMKHLSSLVILLQHANLHLEKTFMILQEHLVLEHQNQCIQQKKDMILCLQTHDHLEFAYTHFLTNQCHFSHQVRLNVILWL